MRYAHGWYCVAFEAEIAAPLHPAAIGDRRLMLARTPDGLRAYDADCPHRGAHLAHGELADGRHVVCPYHGYRIGLGGDGASRLCVAGHETMVFGGAVYVRLSGERDNGWPTLTHRLADQYLVAPGLRIDLHASAEAVIENGFDRLHFHAIHRLAFGPFDVREDVEGALAVRSDLRIPGGRGDMPYAATAFSPGLIFVWLGGDAPYGVITGATATGPAGCTARLSYVIPRGDAEENARRLAELDAYSRRGLTDDDKVWRTVSAAAPIRWTEDDKPVRQFYDYCARFEEASASPG